ncbi:unnamed protein product [Blepharisma stoltei]|uniref:Uncharacterized protein n=1 Tax=Blepharisma stoltei TaxID=1481888 RepID=A0AAU9JXH9_9CILI|nr:unnamed protein product [Blepharisma stoltei]
MANKKATTAAQQQEKYMHDMKKNPQIIQIANGTEFKGEFENLIKQNNIQLIHSYAISSSKPRLRWKSQ